jgi:hypothetical protein
MNRRVLVSGIALSAHLAAPPASSLCVITPDSADFIVRGRFVRCEDARFHLEASGAYGQYARDIEAALARVKPENRETLLDRLGEGPWTPEYQARVAVIAIEWLVPIVPWLRGTSEPVEFKEQPRKFHETIRYWWNGSIDACEAVVPWSYVDLWVHSECCDTPEFGAPVCIVSMNYAEPAPAEMSDVVSEILGDI